MPKKISRENGQNTKMLGPPFSYDMKMAADGYQARKALTVRARGKLY